MSSLIDRQKAKRGPSKHGRWSVARRLADPEGWEKIRKLRQHEKNRSKGRNLKMRMCLKARQRGRKAGLEATIRADDLDWPTHCPVLGIELDYSTPRGQRKANTPNLPSLDRVDNSRGYVLGNVWVISLRANQIKSNATAAELRAIVDYMDENTF